MMQPSFNLLASLLALITLVADGVTCIRPAHEYLTVDEESLKEELAYVDYLIQRYGGHFKTLAEMFKVASSRLERQMIFEAQKAGMLVNRGNEIRGNIEKLYNYLLFLNRIASENPGENEFICSPVGVQYYLITMKHLFGNLKYFFQLIEQKSVPQAQTNRLIGHLLYYGEQHYRECLRNIVDRFNKASNLIDLDAESRMEKLIELAEPSNSGRITEKKVAILAETFDLVEGEFDAEKIAKKGRKLLYEDTETKETLNWRDIVDFFDEACKRISNQSLVGVFKLYNLAREFDPDGAYSSELPGRFYKLNEFIRICDQVNGDEETAVKVSSKLIAMMPDQRAPNEHVNLPYGQQQQQQFQYSNNYGRLSSRFHY